MLLYKKKIINNPNDLLTRKRLFECFKENSLWWEGPEFLKNIAAVKIKHFANEADISKEDVLNEVKGFSNQ